MPRPYPDSAAALISGFVAQLTQAIDEAATTYAREAVLSAFAGASAPAGARGGGRRGRRPGAAVSLSMRKPVGSRQKRDPSVLAATAEQLAAHIAKHPGQRIEQVAKELGIPSKDLALPVKKLMAAKRIKTEGQKRATRYFPAGRQKASAQAKPGRGGRSRTRPAGRSVTQRAAKPRARAISAGRAKPGRRDNRKAAPLDKKAAARVARSAVGKASAGRPSAGKTQAGTAPAAGQRPTTDPTAPAG